MANYWGKDGGCVGGITAVGSYLAGASPSGALDMAGNAWAWVNDFSYRNYPYENPSFTNRAWSATIRGGSAFGDTRDIRAARRSASSTGWPTDNIGFRCAISAAVP